jgi:gliding motility-associated-like protein
MWSLLSGAGDIVSPNNPSTEVINLGVGSNSFVYTITPENGCPNSQDTIVVTVEPGVMVDAGNNVSIESGGSVTLNGTVSPEGGDILWTPSESLSCQTCLSPEASPVETTTYFMSYTSALGCNKIDSVTVSVFTEIPNTITPNGDGVNDVWNIPGIEDYPDAYVVIYNRWGSEIFQSTGYEEPWDGQRDGKYLPTASYFYIIDYKTPGKEKINGTVNIIR